MRKKENGLTATLIPFVFMMAGAGTLKADSLVVGGTGLLTQAGANQLAAWLTGTDLTLTNIFTHTPGDGKTSASFHGAADGQGKTFSVMEVTSVGATTTSLIVGGYDPLSWNSSNSYNVAATDAERTAFLFNLSSNTRLTEKLGAGDSNAGQSQTLNNPNLGPTFGGGPDLRMNSALTSGLAFQYSYGPGGTAGTTILGAVFGGGDLTPTYGRVDVFTIAEGVPTPLPSTALAGAMALCGLGAWQLCHRAIRLPQ